MEPLDATLRLVVKADQSDSVPVETSLRITAPSDRPEIQGIVSSRRGSPEYRRGLARLLDELGLYAPGRLLTALSLAVDQPPDASVHSGVTTLVLTGTRDLNTYLTSGIPGLWMAERRGDVVRFCLERSASVPPGAEWTLDSYVAGADILSAVPVPAETAHASSLPALGDPEPTSPPTTGEPEGDIAHVRWSLTNETPILRSRACPERVGAAPDNVVSFEMRLHDGTRLLMAGYGPRWLGARVALSYLAATLVFLALVYALVAARRDDRLSHLRRPLWLAIGCWLALAGAAAATWLVGDPTQPQLWQLRPSLLGAGFAALLAVAAVASPRRAALAGAAAAVAVLSVLAFVAQSDVGKRAYFEGGWVKTAEAVVAAVSIAALSLCAIAVLTWLLLSHAATGNRLRWLPSWRWSVALAALLALALVAQSASAAYGAWRDRKAVAGLFIPDLDEAGLESWSPWVVGALAYFPFSFVGLVVDLLALIAFAALLVLLGALAERSASPFFGANGGRTVAVLVAFAFAAYVVGTQTSVYAWTAPLAFLLVLGLWPVVRWERTSAMIGEVERLNAQAPGDGPRFLLQAREELLRRGVTIAVLRRRLASLYAAAETPATFEKDVRSTRERIQRLTTGSGRTEADDPPLNVRLPAGSSPGSLAVALGPGSTWWENALIAVRFGAVVAIPPVAYFVYVLATQRLGSDLSPWTDLGVASLLRNTVQEALFWLTAALCLGALFLYLPTVWGVVKGATLAGVFAAAHAVAVWLLPVDGGDWFFRAVELILFLVVLGVILDWQTLVRHGVDWRYLGDHYRVRDVRFAGTYASGAVGAIAVVAQQLQSGEAADTIIEIAKAVPVFIPGPGSIG